MTSQADTDFAAAVNEQDADFFGSAVVVHRGGLTASVTAIAEEEDNEVHDDQGMLTIVRSRNYVIAASEYRFGGQVVEPRSSDRFVETVNGESRTYEAMPIGSLPAFQDSDGDGVRWLVRTKRVG